MTETDNEPTPPGLTRLIVNMTERSMKSIDTTADLLGDTRTDTVNRAAQIYAAVTRLRPGDRMQFNRTDRQLVTLRRVDGAGRRAVVLGLVLIVLAFAAGVVSPW